jgi:hypothetical protein
MRTLPERLRAVYTSYTEDALATDEAAELFEKLDAYIESERRLYSASELDPPPCLAEIHAILHPVPAPTATPHDSCHHCGAWLPTGTMRCNHCGRRT